MFNEVVIDFNDLVVQSVLLLLDKIVNFVKMGFDFLFV
jgi:hypothetical protein